MVGVIDIYNNKIIVGSDYRYSKYLLFMAILDSAQIQSVKSNYHNFISNFSGKRKIFYNLPVLSFSHHDLIYSIEKYDIIFTLSVDNSSF
jgi:hypothetical protein